MKGLLNNRVFERSTFSSLTKNDSEASEVESRKFKYKTLMKVDIYNTYYNEFKSKCPDFRIYPTLESISLMKKTGLIFREENTGFSILYNVHAENKLIRYLKNQSNKSVSSGTEYWSKLSFIAALDNALFVNFTDLPFNMNFTEKNIYLSNRTAHQKSEEIILNPGDYVSSEVKYFINVISTQYVAPFYIKDKGTAKEIMVFNMTGEAVTCESIIPPEKTPLRTAAYFDFSTLPEGLYDIKWFDEEGMEFFQQQVIYTATYPTPLCFIDLLFSRPTENDNGIYPVILDPVGGEVKTVNYQLKFKERSVHWVYWIVPASQSAENMRIKTDDSTGISFSGPIPGHIPTGQKAWSFVSNQTIPMQQRSLLRFKLVDRLNCQCNFACDCKNKVLINPLPLISSNQVLNSSRIDEVGSSNFVSISNNKYSEVYVYV